MKNTLNNNSSPEVYIKLGYQPTFLISLQLWTGLYKIEVNMSGFIYLWRNLSKHWLWQDKPFTKGQAWIDVLFECNHSEQKVLIKDKLILCKRGESLNSLETWGKRWGWNKSKVRRFLKLLKSDTMVELMPERKTTHLKVLYYDKYQNKRNASETQATRKRNASETQVKLNNNDNNDNNDNNKEKIYIQGSKEAVEYFFTFLNINEVKRFEKYNNKFLDVADKLIRIDKYSLENIKNAVKFAKQDSFWGGKNIFQSFAKLRDPDKNGIKLIDVFLSGIENRNNNNQQSGNYDVPDLKITEDVILDITEIDIEKFKKENKEIEEKKIKELEKKRLEKIKSISNDIVFIKKQLKREKLHLEQNKKSVYKHDSYIPEHVYLCQLEKSIPDLEIELKNKEIELKKNNIKNKEIGYDI